MLKTILVDLANDVGIGNGNDLVMIRADEGFLATNTLVAMFDDRLDLNGFLAQLRASLNDYRIDCVHNVVTIQPR